MQDEASLHRLIGEVRKRLLDPSTRNRLLHTPLDGRSRRLIRVVDERIDPLYRFIYEGQALEFLPVPEPREEELERWRAEKGDPRARPTAREWGEFLGIDMAFELEDSPDDDDEHAPRHVDRKIQTPYFRKDLEARLGALYRDYRSYRNETGAHILYAAFGFLEWLEERNGQEPKKRTAPLLLLPIEIERKRIGPRTTFTAKWNGEEPEPNHSLHHFLESSHGLVLPSHEVLESAEDWLHEVSAIIAREKPDWRVRRYVLFGLFNFSSLLLYNDLDPDLWDGGEGLLEHPLVRLALGYEVQDHGILNQLPAPPEHDEDLQLIHDADASQQQVIRDALAGHSLRVEGPPGTGKSQTIANLIGALMERGKTILFVAEKQAALDVVARRMESRGLRAFCLDLHAGNKTTRRIMQEVRDRLDACESTSGPQGVETAWQALRQELEDYFRVLTQPWNETGLSPYEIFGEYARARARLGQDTALSLPDTALPDETTRSWHDPEVRRATLQRVRRLASFAASALEDREARLPRHPWYGIGRMCADEHHIQATLERTRLFHEALVGTENALAELATAAGLETETEALARFSLSAIEGLGTHLQNLPRSLPEALPWSWLQPEASDKRAALHALLEIQETAENLQTRLSRQLPPEWLRNPQFLADAKRAAEQLATDLANAESLGREALAALHRDAKHYAKALDDANDLVALLGRDSPIAAWLLENGKAPDLSRVAQVLEVIAELPPELVALRDTRYDRPEVDPVLTRLEQVLEAHAAEREELAFTWKLDPLPDPEAVENAIESLSRLPALPGWLFPSWRMARRQLHRLTRVRLRRPQLLFSAERLAQWLRQDRALHNDAEAERLLPGFRGPETDLDGCRTLHNWYRRLRELWGWEGKAARVAEALQNLPERTFLELRHRALDQALLQRIREAPDTFARLRQHVPSLSRPDVEADGGCDKIHTLAARLDALPWEAVWDNLPALQALLEELHAWFDLLEERMRQARVLDLAIEDSFGLASPDLEPLRQLAKVDAWLADPRLPVLLEEALRAAPSARYLEAVRGAAGPLQERWDAVREAQNALVQENDFDMARWTGNTDPALGDAIARTRQALEAADRLDAWARFLVQREATRLPDALLEPLDLGLVTPADLTDAAAFRIHAALSAEVIDQNPVLQHFDAGASEEQLMHFRELDNQLREDVARRIVTEVCAREIPEGQYGTRVSERTDWHLITHLLGLTQPKTRPRVLMERARGALSALLPCFLMSPDSVARLLPRKTGLFDVVIMDEASQILPEEALGALARGRQAIIVGDRNQLPPTTFFQRFARSVDEEDDDATPAATGESILEALSILPSRRLTWHYRSRDPRLIAFSNHHFYQDGLVLFPTPGADTTDSPIEHVHVDGTFVNRTNLAEAMRIRDIVQEHVRIRPNKSLGIVAMNVQQRDQIDAVLDALEDEDQAFRFWRDARESDNEPLFVKNLENVQGDERDVIVISLTYGPSEPGGSVPQRFGPVNMAGGERRLNVLFTRAREKLVVVTSLRSSDIVAGPGSHRGVQILHDFLRYVESGQLGTDWGTPSGRPPGSPFEEAVIDALSARGWQCESQWGVSGYFIDIAVRHPDHPERFLAGIECDGAAWHSSRTARERDRLRQQVLEKLGWKILRIWSTDWFRRPEGTLNELIARLEMLL